MNALGFVSLSAITVLASPRPIDPQRGTRNIVFDANLFVVDGSQTSCLGLFRYFIPDRETDILKRFSEKRFQKAFIVANISSVPNNAISPDLISPDLITTDYAFQGDIIQLTFIEGYVDEKTSPYISVTGTVASFHADDSSFDMSPCQYTALTHSSSPLPIHGYFIESKRWGENKKPKLFTGTSVSFGGFLDKIHRERDPKLERALTQVEIEVLAVSFIPTQTTFGGGSTSNSPLSRPPGFRTRWDYNSPSTKPSLPYDNAEASSSKSPSQNIKKRKHNDLEDNESDKTIFDDDKDVEKKD